MKTVKEMRQAINVMSKEMLINIAEFAKEAGVSKFNGNTKRADVELVHDRMTQVYNERKTLVNEIVKLGGKADMKMSRKDLNKLYRELYMKANQKPANGETPAAGNKTQGGKNMANNKSKKAGQHNVQGGEQPMVVLSPEAFNKELKAAIAEVTKPLHEAIEQLKRENDMLRQQLSNAKKSGKATKADTKKADAPKADNAKSDPKREAIRARYIAMNDEMEKAQEAYHKALESGDEEAIKKAKKAYDDIFNKITEMNKDASIREHIADFFDNAADVVDEYGHKGVAGLRNVLHKGVDVTCDVLDKGVDATAGALRATGNIVGGRKVGKPATTN